jgi:AcrR family transcriptional regulator
MDIMIAPDQKWIRDVLRLYLSRQGHGALGAFADKAGVHRHTVRKFRDGDEVTEDILRRIYETLAALGLIDVQGEDAQRKVPSLWTDGGAARAQDRVEEERGEYQVNRVTLELPYEQLVHMLFEAQHLEAFDEVNNLIELGGKLRGIKEHIEEIEEDLDAFSERVRDIQHKLKERVLRQRMQKEVPQRIQPKDREPEI